MIIGICGKTGSGKTYLSNYLKENRHDVIHLDVNKLEDKIKEEIKRDLIIKFGRNFLSKLITSNLNFMYYLTVAAKKYAEQEITREIKSHPNSTIIIDWTNLQQSSFFKKCNVTILLDVPYYLRRTRITVRDKITDTIFDLRDDKNFTYNVDSFDFVIKDVKKEFVREMLKL